jgi:hypothetical protein
MSSMADQAGWEGRAMSGSAPERTTRTVAHFQRSVAAQCPLRWRHAALLSLDGCKGVHVELIGHESVAELVEAAVVALLELELAAKQAV